LVIIEKILKRFWDKVETTNSCWNWKGCLNNAGYGMFRVNGKNYSPHRFSFETFIHKIPENMIIDHLCKNRSCVNPAHLDFVTNQENIRRGKNYQSKQTHCKRGHEFNAINSRLSIDGKRVCKICRNDNQNKKRKLRGKLQ